MGSYQSQIYFSLNLLALLTLIGCSQSEQPAAIPNVSNTQNVNKNYTYKNKDFLYQLEIPADFADQKGNDSEMYFGYAHDSITGDLLVSIFNKESIACSPSITGSSQTAKILDSKELTMWGRVDAWDNMDVEGWEYPQDWEKILCKKQGTPLPKSIYSLCSEKAGKTVVICLDQMADNPSLAKQIFESFKWIDK